VVQPTEPESNAVETVLPIDQPLPADEASIAEETLQAEETPIPEASVAPQAGSIEEPVSTEEMTIPVHEEAPVEVEPVEPDHESPGAQLPETNPPTPSSTDLLSRLLDDEESFEQTMVAAGATAGVAAPVPPFVPAPANRPAPQPSVFSGNIELDTLLHNGVVTDAGALAQLFRGGYRNRISKLAVSAKDLQNVPEEMRQVIKLTVVALSPIEKLCWWPRRWGMRTISRRTRTSRKTTKTSVSSTQPVSRHQRYRRNPARILFPSARPGRTQSMKRGARVRPSSC
jgi:hypothetical protein